MLTPGECSGYELEYEEPVVTITPTNGEPPFTITSKDVDWTYEEGASAPNGEKGKVFKGRFDFCLESGKKAFVKFAVTRMPDGFAEESSCVEAVKNCECEEVLYPY